MPCQELTSHRRKLLPTLTDAENKRSFSTSPFLMEMHQGGGGAVAVEEGLLELRRTFRSGRTRPVAWRKAQLRAIINLVRDNEDRIFGALLDDLGKHPVESYRDEVGVVLKSAKHALSCVEKWMAPRKGDMPLLFFPASGEILPEPLGTVLIFSSWNFPITLALEPVIGAVAAGNTVVLKPSELAPSCSSFLAETLPLYLDNRAVKVIAGGPDVGERLLEQRWDKIFFTGSPQVGRIVMSAAAKHLTPVTLELGGKCPTIVDNLSSPSDIKIAVKRIAGAKWGPCSGQACIGIDYVLVEEKLSGVLIDLLRKTVRRFYGEEPKNSKNMCKIINRSHFERLRNLLNDPAVAASIVHGGSVDEERLFIEPTILLDPPLEAEIMTEEIFGPLLPIITLRKIHTLLLVPPESRRDCCSKRLQLVQLNNIRESIEFINSRPKPLAMYVFTKDESFKQQILQETSSGSVTFNDAMVQFVCDSLPFGGVGQSGFGRYHGKYSFDTFSHEKAVMRRGFFPEIEPRYPPWNDFKLKFIKLAYDFDYLGLILLMLGLKRN